MLLFQESFSDHSMSGDHLVTPSTSLYSSYLICVCVCVRPTSPFHPPTPHHMFNFMAKHFSSLAWIIFIFLKLDKKITHLDFLDSTKYPSQKRIWI